MGGKRAEKSLGARFGRLVVVAVDRPAKGCAIVHAICDCGGSWIGPVDRLRGGNTKSCGCLSRDSLNARAVKHGMSKTAEYKTWKSIKHRCYRARKQDFHLYQGKGIEMCDRWLHSFENFIHDMGQRPSSKHSIDRIDSEKGYEPGNCRWATAQEQARNTSRNVLISYQGQQKTLMEWCESLKLTHSTTKSRLAQGWTVEKAFTAPVAKSKTGEKFSLNGESLTLTEWSRKIGVACTTILYRINAGWSIEKALTTEVRRGNKR